MDFVRVIELIGNHLDAKHQRWAVIGGLGLAAYGMERFTLDLDIVRYGDRAVHEPRLTIPHPELANRDFWLREIAELDALPLAGRAGG